MMAQTPLPEQVALLNARIDAMARDLRTCTDVKNSTLHANALLRNRLAVMRATNEELVKENQALKARHQQRDEDEAGEDL